MFERDPIEMQLKAEAVRISEKYGGAPVVIIIAGHAPARVPYTMTASSYRQGQGRMRDLLGILQTSIQIESRKHLQEQGIPPLPGNT
jgi:hypothetical protein